MTSTKKRKLEKGDHCITKTNEEPSSVSSPDFDCEQGQSLRLESQTADSCLRAKASTNDQTLKEDTTEPLPSTLPLPKCRTPTLFVGGLHPRVADVHLHKLFQPYGKIRRIHQCLHREGSLTGQPRGYGFVEYESVDSASLAMSRVDGRVLLGRRLVVRPAHDKTSGGGSADDRDYATGTVLSAGAGGTHGAPSDPTLLRKERSEVDAKIAAVRRALLEKQTK